MVGSAEGAQSVDGHLDPCHGPVGILVDRALEGIFHGLETIVYRGANLASAALSSFDEDDEGVGSDILAGPWEGYDLNSGLEGDGP